MSTRSNRFSASFQPLRTNMRTLRTAFSPPRSSRSASTTSYSSTSTTPLTHSHSPSHSPSSSHSSSSHSRNASPQSMRSAHSLADVLALRRAPSERAFESAREARVFAVGLQVLEPRPREECEGVVGIFEVLDGKY